MGRYGASPAGEKVIEVLSRARAGEQDARAGRGRESRKNSASRSALACGWPVAAMWRS